MNQILNPQKLAGLCVLLATTLFMSGCGGAFSYSRHTTVRASEVRGRVLDAKSRSPIQGAKLSFLQEPFDPIYTDINGCFYAKAVTNTHWLRGADGSGYPNRKMGTRNISHTNYVTRTGDWSGDAGDIFLQPK